LALLITIILFESLSGTPFEDGWITNLLTLLTVIVSIILSFCSSFFIPAKEWRWTVSGVFTALLGVGWLFGSFGPGGDKVIGSLKMSDGRDVCLLHTYTGDFADPYFVSFCARNPNSPWKVFYLRRGDTRWWFGTVTLSADRNTAIVRKFFYPVARYSLKTDQVTLLQAGISYDGYQKDLFWTPQKDLKPN
jgi:hypothetical protein